MPTRYQVGLHDLTGSEHQIVHAYKVSGQGCRISRGRKIRSNMLTRYQDGAAGSHGFGSTDPNMLKDIRTGLRDLTVKKNQIGHANKVSGRGCRISLVGNYRTYMPTRYQDGTGSNGFQRSDRTSLLDARTVLHDLTGSEHKVLHAYKVSERSCKISRARNTRSYMPRGYQDGAAGSHG